MTLFRSFLPGITILWDGVSFLELRVPPKFTDRMCGLCGNFDGDASNDFYGRHGERHLSGQTFGDDWRVGGLRACSVLPRDMPHSYEPQCTQSWEAKIKSDKNCNALNSPLFRTCRARVDPDYYYNACKLDMCECPGDSCHCEVLTAYARECERADIMVHTWREVTGCVNVTSFSFSNEIEAADTIGAANTAAEADRTTTERPTSLAASGGKKKNSLGRIQPGEYFDLLYLNRRCNEKFIFSRLQHEDLSEDQRKRDLGRGRG